jgi:Tol biopolymer transport system component
MIKKLNITILIVLTLTVGTLAFQNGYDLFQKALAKERAEGNLEEAIALYQKVIEDSKDESLAAKAQLRIGICYEKLGRKEAQKAFQKVIDNYPKQIDTVKMAQEKLAILAKAEAFVEKKETGIHIRQVLAGPELRYDGDLGSVSPDGRYISITDWKTGDLAIREVATGNKRNLTNKGTWKESSEFTLYSKWSPDGKKIVYDWWEKEGFIDLRITGLNNKEPHTIFQNEEILYAWPLAWYPNEDRVLIAFTKDNKEIQIALLSIEDGSIQILRKFRRNLGTAGVFISPDGRQIVYDKRKNEEFPEKDIFLFLIEETKEIPLVEHTANDEILGWSPDGKWILFRSDRLRSSDVWALRIADGKPKGDPEIIKKGAEDIHPLGFSLDGSFYYMSNRGMRNIYTLNFNPKTEEIEGKPAKMTLEIEGKNTHAEYSSDGKYLAYIYGGMDTGTNRSTLHMRSLEAGEERNIKLKFRALYPRWSYDQKSIFFTGIPEPGRWGIFRVDIQTGAITQVLPDQQSNKGNFLYTECSHKENTFYYIKEDAGSLEFFSQIYRYSLGKGEKEKVYQSPSNNMTLSLSPNDEWLAFTEIEVMDKEDFLDREVIIKVISAQGGEAEELYRFKKWGGGPPVDLGWTPDSRKVVFFKKKGNEKESWQLCRVPVEGDNIQEFDLDVVSPESPRFHPDGHQVVFSSRGFSKKYPEIWVMENFLPEETKDNPDEK